MKNGLEILLAGTIGLAAVVSVVALRKVLKDKTYKSDYSDSHGIFIKNNNHDRFSRHGDAIEFHAML